MASNKTDEFQQQMLDLLHAQQDAYLTAVKAWRDSFVSAGTAGVQPPPWPAASPLDMLPTAAEVTEASYTFAAKLLADQSRFLEALSKAMAIPEKKA